MRILVVDDEKSIRLSIVMGLKKLNVSIDEAENGLVAIEKFRKAHYDMVLLDIKMPEMDGIEVLRQIKQLNKSCTVIMMTHLSEVRLAVEAMKLGASEYFTKPFSIEELTDIVRELMVFIPEKTNQSEAVKMIGQSKDILSIYKKIERLKLLNAKTSILVYGESGTGKELVATMISEICAKDKPHVSINCAAIPKHLQESELFGHEKGAFSDAKEKRIGLFENANGGVLFLDEIADMDLELQAKLLRVLQEKKFRRLGGNPLIPFDAYIVAASNKNLKVEVEAGRFRKDLFYRLNIIPINIPPLRDRKDDLEDLVQHFINEYNVMFGRSVKGISEPLLQAFKSYDWPGNIRELKNIIERLMILGDGDVLTEAELPYELIDKDDDKYLLNDLESAEQDAVLKALSTYGWNITKAADSLGISRLTLRRKIDKYGLKK